MIARSLSDWLVYLEALHPKKWDLGLARVGSVAERMGLLAQPGRLFLVGGTNGKGSTVTLIEHLARHHGYSTGASLSPHLLRFNERIQLDGKEVADEEICDSFARIEKAREATSLTYFEFAALAALDVFQRHAPDVIVLEVGLGGRLDAMNIVHPHVAVVTGVDLDHQAWLGNDRETIGREKAGIFRESVPAVIGDPAPPSSLAAHALGIGARPVIRNRDFGAGFDERGWNFWLRKDDGTEVRLDGLPRPRLHPDNAATALAAWHLGGLDFDRAIAERVVENTDLAGRCQELPGPVPVLLDVAHNPQAAGNLAKRLENSACEGRTVAVVAMFRDKDCEGFLAQLAPFVDEWCCAGLDGDRGQSGEELKSRLGSRRGSNVTTYDRVDTAFHDALRRTARGDRIVVTGSFLTVAAALQASRVC